MKARDDSALSGFWLATTSAAHQAEVVTRLRDLGATSTDTGQGDVPWTVLADPEGDEFCRLAPG